MNKLICRICKLKLKSYFHLAWHVRKIHNTTSKSYYDKYIKKKREGLCKRACCSNITAYRGTKKGYLDYCSMSCFTLVFKPWKYMNAATSKKMRRNHWSKHGYTSWCKGLTKETDKRVARLAKKGRETKLLNYDKTLKAARKAAVTIKKSGVLGGPNNPRWRGGISKLPYSFEFTRELKDKIRRRDNYICQWCFKTQNQNIKESNRSLDIHHIDYCKKNNNESNLVSLCVSCHMKTNSNRYGWQFYFENKMHYEILPRLQDSFQRSIKIPMI